MVEIDTLQTEERIKRQEISTVPLIIKKYDQGKFTSEFLTGLYNKNIKISKPRGRGLNLQ